MIQSFKGKTPKIAATAYIHETAVIIGDVTIGAHANIWPNVVIRGDINSITIGDRTNVQDATVIHVDHAYPTVIEHDVTIGHSAIIHACTIKHTSLVGMGATVLDRAVVGEYAMVGANGLVSPGSIIPPKTLAVGMPAKPKRELSPEEIEGLKHSAEHYCEIANEFKKAQDGE